uniref:Lipoprotein n=1 Tax=uncultured Bacillota bacterium TaxID=344338 RepID=A0A650EPX6_9FIRM|nr:hypothetical protein Firmicute1046_0600 [uncultured Firmicutes bacterium]
MKKIIALVLAVGMCFSLCSCGDGNNQVVGKWKSLTNLEDYDFFVLNEFKKDGTGISTNAQEFRWVKNDDEVAVSIGTGLDSVAVEYKILNFDGIPCLEQRGEYYIPANKFESNAPKVKAAIAKQVEEIPANEVSQAPPEDGNFSGNGELRRYTGKVLTVESDSLKIDTGGVSLEAKHILPEEIKKIKPDDTVTVVGVLRGLNKQFELYCSFIVED